MAVRRGWEPSPPSVGRWLRDLPEKLRTCIIEDWSVPGDDVGRYLQRPDLEGAFAREVVAWRRWQAARRAWCAENGVDVESLPGGGPRWR